MSCEHGHAWVAGMMYVHDEDLMTVTAVRDVECEGCELTIGPTTPRTVVQRYAYGEE